MKNTLSVAVFLSLTVACSVAAYAAKNDNRFQNSAEAQHNRRCAELKSNYDFNMSYYKGDPAKRGKWKKTASDLKLIAQFENCSWAA